MYFPDGELDGLSQGSIIQCSQIGVFSARIRPLAACYLIVHHKDTGFLGTVNQRSNKKKKRFLFINVVADHLQVFLFMSRRRSQHPENDLFSVCK